MSDTPVLTAREWEAVHRAVKHAAPLFRRFGWTYDTFSPHVPTENELRDAIAELIGHAREQSGTVSSGRFAVEWDGIGGYDIRLDIALGNTAGYGDVDLPEPEGVEDDDR